MGCQGNLHVLFARTALSLTFRQMTMPLYTKEKIVVKFFKVENSFYRIILNNQFQLKKMFFSFIFSCSCLQLSEAFIFTLVICTLNVWSERVKHASVFCRKKPNAMSIFGGVFHSKRRSHRTSLRELERLTAGPNAAFSLQPVFMRQHWQKLDAVAVSNGSLLSNLFHFKGTDLSYLVLHFQPNQINN